MKDCVFAGALFPQFQTRHKLSAMRMARVNRDSLTDAQLEKVLEVEAELTQIFKKYDRKRDGSLFALMLSLCTCAVYLQIISCIL